MIFYKSDKVKFEALARELEKSRQQGHKYGFMYMAGNQMVAHRGYSLDNLKAYFYNSNYGKDEIDKLKIAVIMFKCNDRMDCPPFVVTHDLSKMTKFQQFEPEIMEFEMIESDNVCMIDKLPFEIKLSDTSKVDSKKLTPEKDYVANVINAFSSETLENTIAFMLKYHIFNGINMVLLNRKTKFKFIGKYKTINGEVISNGKIFNATSIVVSQETKKGGNKKKARNNLQSGFKPKGKGGSNGKKNK